MISFKRLRRGVKLLAEHIYDPIHTTLQLLTASGVTHDHLDTPSGSFRINLYIPVYTTVSGGTAAILGGFGDTNPQSIPFFIPPFQEYTRDALGFNTSTRPDVFLREVSLSTDTRAEPVALQDYWTDVDAGAANHQSAEGDMRSNAAEDMGYELIIYSKDISPSRPTRFENIIYRMEVPAAALNQSVLRLNPYVQSGLKVEIDPEKAYLAQFTAKKGLLPKPQFSVSMSMKFSHQLVARDTTANIQNIPSHNGVFAPVTESFVKSAANDAIVATGAKGINTGFEKIDDLFTGKLRGGYNRFSQRHEPGTDLKAENILECAGYDVLAVNLFSGFWAVKGGTGGTVADGYMRAQDLPYLNATANTWTFDRRIIPLPFPMTIHHVFASVNFSGTKGQMSRLPTTSNFKNRIGVGLMTGIRADKYTYDQVAYLEWDNTFAATIDRSAEWLDDSLAAPGERSQGYFFHTVPVPLVGSGGNTFDPIGGISYTQGRPVFAGQGVYSASASYAPTHTRSNINTGAPNCAGAEQALEVRWSFGDTTNGMVHTATYPNQEMVLGLGGHWVFIYGKKHLV